MKTHRRPEQAMPAPELQSLEVPSYRWDVSRYCNESFTQTTPAQALSFQIVSTYLFLPR